MRYAAATSAAVVPLVGERLWLDFVNTDARDVLDDFPAFLAWLEVAGALEVDRAPGIQKRAEQQPAGASAVLADARRVRAALRNLAERGATVERARLDALTEINRVLGRSAGTRRIDLRPDGRCSRTFSPVGDAFAGLMIPIVDSAADSLVTNELPRIRRCVGARCTRVFFDGTKNCCRRWCDMSTCGNRAKAARHRARRRSTAPSSPMPPAPRP
jgi:predicted RNA-binding Zn ribbon-like protein